ncbi:SDR family NAD(P)-dependent oxidoreductase [Paenibacillus monticola]|uniref:SDR family NAD(P)-dependent oxidoreductase n=1 Tax=Paenibacillus monticola TaxID=2666075 RepID=A0A7X2L085_9BACL|nr:SDR family NAD(P)-dependent oxidoreductase [Paenibacillus monticola]MRN51863.1 SDR family NAD(P)-dependent oxidoreductase [Paenibacillus monticola]
MRGQILNRKQILEQIQSGHLSPAAGYDLIQSLQQGKDNRAAQDERIDSKPTDIAVIGMSGRFPGASDLNMFWNNLTRGVDSVTGIPQNRWRYESGGSQLKASGKPLQCDRGGFIDGIDEFDPLFFNISPREAELMDPQQRIFLQTAWHAIEDAGYAPEDLSGSKCGVFTGATQGDYYLNIRNSDRELDSQVLTGYSNSILAARISYFLNLKGPSIPIDTACSASLVAVHQACQSIMHGDSEWALAGGIYLLSTPEMHEMTEKGGMLSPEGKCKAFSHDADGFVPGEGVGVVLLKPLAAAIRDHDHIYGIIKGSAINQDGKTNGITAPSAVSQHRLQNDCYQRYGIDPDSISYLEAHGTGTQLGDPIEISALSKTFAQYTSRKQFCAIGSVKANIGHTLTAAGAASLIKVLLSMKYGKLVPSLHYQSSNVHIKFEDTPFYVNTALKEWKQEDGQVRRAAVSSYGLSGTNCHMVIEEFLERPTIAERSPSPLYLFPFSAKTADALEARMREFHHWLLNEKMTVDTAADISFTLAAGRNHFSFRSIITACNLDELRHTLEQVLAGNKTEQYATNIEAEGLPTEQPTAKVHSSAPSFVGFYQESIQTLKERTASFVRFYLEGGKPDFMRMYEGLEWRRVAGLPGYPFAKESYWIAGEDNGRFIHTVDSRDSELTTGAGSITEFDGTESVLKDHLVGGVQVLPGAAYVDLAIQSAKKAGYSVHSRLRGVTWLHPFSVEQGPMKLEIVFTDEVRLDNELRCQAFSDGEQGRLIHFQADLFTGERSASLQGSRPTAVKKSELIRFMKPLDVEQCYEQLRSNGIEHRGSFKSIRELYSSGTETVALLELQEDSEHGKTPANGQVMEMDSGIHPALLDGAFQSAIGIDGFADSGYIPFSADEIMIYSGLPKRCYVHTRHKGSAGESRIQRFDMVIFDEQGEVLIQVNNLLARGLKDIVKPSPDRSLLYFREEWQVVPVSEVRSRQLRSPGNVLVFEEGSQWFDYMQTALSEAELMESTLTLVKQADRYHIGQADTFGINTNEPAHYQQLVEELNQSGRLPATILYISKEDKASDSSVFGLSSKIRSSFYPMLYLCQALIGAKLHHPVTLYYIYHSDNSVCNPHQTAMTGFARTLNLENPQLELKTVELYNIDKQEQAYTAVFNLLTGSARAQLGPEHDLIRFADGQMLLKQLVRCEPVAGQEGLTLRTNGVYLITGGLGGIGMITAAHLARLSKVKIVLTGRTAPNLQQQQRISHMQSSGSEVTFMQADIADRESVDALVLKLKQRYGRINGIFHSAGVLRDSFILRKTREEAESVIAPKAYAVCLLDHALKDEPLDFFILYSAIASIVGNPGQSDYAYANRFMDDYARHREQCRMRGQRSGITVSINWPLWAEGGMTIPEYTAQNLRKRLGMLPMTTRNGLQALHDCLTFGHPSVMVLEGNEREVMKSLGISAVNESHRSSAEPAVNLQSAAEQLLKDVFAKVIQLSTARISEHALFEQYGIDSIVVMKINDELEAVFGRLSKTLLFEYTTIAALAQYFVSKHANVLSSRQTELEQIQQMNVIPDRVADPEEKRAEESPLQLEGFAVIGLGGRYPQAEGLEEFWDNLVAGKDCITEIPTDRWDARTESLRNKASTGKQMSKWGGFIDGADQFDPLFFNISPKDAIGMDPQERLFLETAWNTLEDAGYTRQQLDSKEIGVFVGVMYGHYPLIGLTGPAEGNPAVNSSFASIANRVSYYFNWCGPSMAVDTMCSSSLTALHLACESLRRKESELALAGGVNLSLHPLKYQVLGEGQFTSSDGRCRSFGEGGDGYVPGEGVGAVLLKPLELAVRDGDHIYGVIKSTAINHGGRTNGYTVPNPNAQAKVIARAVAEAKIEPRTISYIEAHGTGTSLGDPIEITGLAKAFGAYSEDKQYCRIGSVKSNIGHLESAAGIAGLTKLLLQLEHKQLVPSLHADQLNPFIDLEETPFSVQKKLEYWPETVVESHGELQKYPRRGGLSAFGAGGSNAHVLVEDYEENYRGRNGSLTDTERRLIVLSAHSMDRLQASALKLAAFVERSMLSEPSQLDTAGEDSLKLALWNSIQQGLAEITGIKADEIRHDDALESFSIDPVQWDTMASQLGSRWKISIGLAELFNHRTAGDLADHLYWSNPQAADSPAASLSLQNIGYTLQAGREAMEYRLAFVVSNCSQLQEVLEAFGQGRAARETLFTGKVKKHVEENAPYNASIQEQVEQALVQRDLSLLAEYWVEGAEIEWTRLYPHAAPRRVSLPTYPFKRKRYWLNTGSDRLASSTSTTEPAVSSAVELSPSVASVPAAAAAWAPLELESSAGYAGDEVTLEVVEGNIALVTMRDKPNKNMFSNNIMQGLMAKFHEIKGNPNLKAVVLTGYDHVFCMGGTREQLLDISEKRSQFTDNPFMFRGLLEAEIPVISAMQGHASGGGMLFGLFADIVIMAEESIYSAVFTKFGFTPGMGATLILKERFGPNIATELMYTARSYSGEELKNRGASVLFRKRADVLQEALNIARSLAEKPLFTLKVLKKELSAAILEKLPLYIQKEIEMHELTFNHPEVIQRIQRYHVSSQDMPSEETIWQKEASAALQSIQTLENEAPETAFEDNAEGIITAIVSRILHLPAGEWNADSTFKELGTDSISGIEIIREVNSSLGVNFDAVVLYDYPTIQRLAQAVRVQKGKPFLHQQDPPAPPVKPEPHAKLRQVENAPSITLSSTLDTVMRAVKDVLHIADTEQLEADSTFNELGVDSISGVEITRLINALHGLHVDAVALYDHPTLNRMAKHVFDELSRSHAVSSAFVSLPVPPLSDSVLLEPVLTSSYLRSSNRTEAKYVPQTGSPRQLKIKLGAASTPLSTAGRSERREEQATPSSEDSEGERGTGNLADNRQSGDDVAVIGMAGRFPGADNITQFWSNLKNGVDSISEVPQDRWNMDSYYDEDAKAPGKSYCKVGGFIKGADRFDPLFFNISPVEAELMDPQQRVFLEECWKALEDAGYSDRSLSDIKCGVFVGATQGDYLQKLSVNGHDKTAEAFTGSSSSILAGRVSYFLNLKGPSIAIETACSSSLVAVHQACQSIRSGECQMALAGGIRLMFTPDLLIQSSKMGILSPSGQCRTFDKNADGTLISEGAGVVVLKPLKQALLDGDPIYGVIKGSGINQDGKTNGITAPSSQSQIELERGVYTRYAINPEDIGYVEAHGTATKLGDPIEVKALTEAFGFFTAKKQYCAIGSVKSNIGHTTMAGGIAGLIKALLSLKAKQIPPSLHYEEENEHIHFRDTPFYVNTQLAEWAVKPGVRRMAAVSAFGFSGTNCHIVLEEAP